MFFVLLISTQLKSQSLELIGGASIIRPKYTGSYFVVGRFGASLNQVLLNKKLGFYALYENAKWYNGNFVDIFGVNYQVDNKISIYYGHSIISNPTLNPSKWPISGRQDLGISYKFETLPIRVNVGWAFWNGPAISLSFRMPKATVKDSDFDGVSDKHDKCPGTSIKYVKNVDTNGCPVDSDMDGVLDLDDSCKFEKGYNSCYGCPDTDLDGIPNFKDRCPTEKGKPEYNGCLPPVAKDSGKLIEQKNEFSDEMLIRLNNDSKVKFEFASSDIPEFQMAKIKSLAQFLVENRNFHIDIIGHADDIGSDESNFELSLRRANAYFAKLANLGVYVSQMTVIGKGESQPEISGNSDMARIANRRVEVVLKR